MSVTPQTNITLENLAAELLAHDDFVLCGHVNPDGDCLGSQLALMHALRAAGKNATCLLVNADPVEAGLQFLPGVAELVPAAEFTGAARTFIACDVPLAKRMGTHAAELQKQASVRFTIDHHAHDQVMSEFNYVDPDAPACGMIMWELIGKMGVERTPEIATCCYAALMTDTGRFQYQNATAAAFRAAMEMIDAGADPAFISAEVYQNRTVASLMLEKAMLENMRISPDGKWVLSYISLDTYAKYGAVKSDAEPLIDVLRSLTGVCVACVLRAQDDCVRGSLRAKDATTDVSALARKIGGGGHKAAAGFTYEGSLEDALEYISGQLDELTAGHVG